MPGYVSGESNVEMDGLRPKRRFIGQHFRNDPVISSILYSMRDPGMKKVKVDDVEGTEDPLVAMYQNQAETRPSTPVSVRRPHVDSGDVTLMDSSIHKEGPNIRSAASASEQGADNATTATTTGTTVHKKRGSNAAHSKRYRDVMDALLRPVSSYDLIYRRDFVPTSKEPCEKKVSKKSIQESVHKTRPEKTPTKKEILQFRSFPQNVRTLTGTGMLDGVAVQYLSASTGKELRGIIKGPTFLCGCQSCNYSKAVNAYELETHAGCKTSHPNNHIHLDNGKSLHQVVQELKKTAAGKLCDAIEYVIGDYLNREAFSSWKESFEAASLKFDNYDSSNQDKNLI